MTELRYNRTFKKGIVAILFCVLLFGSIVAFFIISKVQYDRLVSGMQSLEATIVDIDLDIHVRGPNEQKIYIEYEVDGITYSRELKTDTALSFTVGSGAHYSVGEKIPIFYDPQDPKIIASPRSQSVGIFWLIFALLSLALVLFVLWWVIKSHRKFLVTQEEYDKEGEELRRSKLAKNNRRSRINLKEKRTISRQEKY